MDPLCNEAEVTDIVHEGVELVKCLIVLSQNLLGQCDWLLVLITLSDAEAADLFCNAHSSLECFQVNVFL